MKPLLHKLKFFLLSVGYRLRWECGGRLVREKSVLIPFDNVRSHIIYACCFHLILTVMYGTFDKNEWLVHRIGSLRGLIRMGRGRSPRVCLSVDNSQAGITDVPAPIFVDGFGIRRTSDIESVPAWYCVIRDVNRAGNQGELVTGDTAAGDNKAPSTTVSNGRGVRSGNLLCTPLIIPASPCLIEIILGIAIHYVLRETGVGAGTSA